MIRLNEMILAPFVACFMAFLGKGDIVMIIGVVTKARQAWMDWLEFQDLRFKVQRMYLVTTMLGGPFIRANDPEYQAYVYADAVVRAQTGLLRMTDKRRPRPA